MNMRPLNHQGRKVFLLLLVVVALFGLAACEGNPGGTVPDFEYWESLDDLNESIRDFGVYDSSKQRVEVGKVVPAYPFDGMHDSPSGKPVSFANLVFGPNEKYSAQVYLFPGQGDTDYFNKPLIVGDAFDPFNERGAETIYSDKQYRNLLSVENPMYPRAMGYDIYFINFAQGSGDILINSALELALIEWVQQQTAADIVVGGPSMSGIISRLALLYALPQNHVCPGSEPCAYLTPQVSGYLSIDAPQQGASLDPNFQGSIRWIWTGLYDRCKNTVGAICRSKCCDQVEGAKTNYWQLKTPATYQMLYAHGYPDDSDPLNPGSLNLATAGHDNFYGYLERIGDYNPYVPKVSIAYSNFYAPHGDKQAKTTEQVKAGEIDLPFDGTVCSRLDFNPPYYAGGVRNSSNAWLAAGYHELSPGSATDRFYYDLVNRHSTKIGDTKFRNQVWEGEVYKGTFIPIYSALDLAEEVDWRDIPTGDERELAMYTPFESVFYMHDEFNHYSAQTTADDKRYQHIVFDDQLMTAVSQGLSFLETSPCALPKSGDWEVGRNCTLQGDYQADGNIVVKEGITLTIPAGKVLDVDFQNHSLRIKQGGKLIVEPGAKIS